MMQNNFKKDVLNDFWICLISREASLLGRKEVLNGRAKFGILGDGKELPQVAMARAFRKGDWRSGYYRDQTFMFARGLCTLEEFFFQLYADTENDPFSGGRQMNSHYATPMMNKNGDWLDQTKCTMFLQIFHVLPVKWREAWGSQWLLRNIENWIYQPETNFPTMVMKSVLLPLVIVRLQKACFGKR
jgi:hypothetical protein